MREKAGEKCFSTRMSRSKSGNLLRKIGVKAGVKSIDIGLVVKLNLHKNQEDRGENEEKAGRKVPFCDQT